MGTKQLYNDYLRKLPNEYGDVSVMSDRATLHIYFSLAVSGSIGDRFEFTNLRSYSSKSEFFYVFKQDKCPSFDFKRFFICLCLRSFDGLKTLINCLLPMQRLLEGGVLRITTL